MLGEAVTHVRYGAGTVCAFEEPRIGIAFADGTTRTFAYPQSVGRFIRFDSDEAQRRAEGDRDRAEILAKENAMAMLLANRQRAEEEARRQVEALHEKKVAAARRTAARSAAARRAREQDGGEA